MIASDTFVSSCASSLRASLPTALSALGSGVLLSRGWHLLPPLAPSTLASRGLHLEDVAVYCIVFYITVIIQLPLIFMGRGMQ